MTRIAIRAAVLVLGAVLLSGAPARGRPAAAVPGLAVGIKEFTYRPPQLQVRAGTTITWTNRDEEVHTVTSSTGAFASAGLGQDETFTQTFTKPGTYTYFCALHPHMRATVVVR